MSSNFPFLFFSLSRFLPFCFSSSFYLLLFKCLLCGRSNKLLDPSPYPLDSQCECCVILYMYVESMNDYKIISNHSFCRVLVSVRYTNYEMYVVCLR
jgi:hypothetical protein